MFQIKQKRTILLIVMITAVSFFLHASFGLAQLPSDTYEPNNTMGTASTLSPGIYTDLTLSSSSDADFYNITINPGYGYIFTIYNYSYDIYVDFYNSSGDLIQSYDNYGPITFAFASNNTQVCSLEISGWTYTYYSLNITQITDPNENDDNFASSNGIGYGYCSGFQLFDSDYYQIYIGYSDTINITLIPTEIYQLYLSSSAEVNIILYYPNETIAAESENTLDTSQESETLLYFNNLQLSGYYYVAIVPGDLSYTNPQWDSSPIQYDLNISSIQDDQYESNNYRSSATPLTYSMEYAQGNNGFSAMSFNDDWYSVNITNTNRLFYVALQTGCQINNLVFDIVNSTGVPVAQCDNWNLEHGQSDSNFYVSYMIPTAGIYYIYISSTEHFAYNFIFSELYTSHPADQSVMPGSLGNEITWTVHDKFFDYMNQTTINAYIYENQQSLLSTQTLGYSSNGINVTQNISNMTQGTYLIQLNVYEDSFYYTIFNGNSYSDVFIRDNVTVTVGAGNQISISGPSSDSYVNGTKNNIISWTPTGIGYFNVQNYTVYENQKKYISGHWESGNSIKINIDGLAVGTYNFTIKISGDNLMVQKTTILTVTANNTNSEPHKSVPGYNVPLIFLLIFGSIACISIVSRKRLHFS